MTFRPGRADRNLWSAITAASLLVTAAANAQPRFTIGPMVSYARVSPVYDHTVNWPPINGGPTATERTRLGVDAATTFGLFAEVRLPGAWTVGFDALRGSSDYEYHWRMGSSGLASEEWRRGSAELTAYSARVGRALPLPRNFATLVVSVGGALQRVNVKGYPPCQPPTPSLPPSPGLCGSEKWQRSYGVPSATTSLQLRRKLVGRTELQIGGSFAAGQANTSAFWTDLLPEYDAFEAKKTQSIRTSQLRMALGIGL